MSSAYYRGGQPGLQTRKCRFWEEAWEEEEFPSRLGVTRNYQGITQGERKNITGGEANLRVSVTICGKDGKPLLKRRGIKSHPCWRLQIASINESLRKGGPVLASSRSSGPAHPGEMGSEKKALTREERDFILSFRKSRDAEFCWDGKGKDCK